jgi:hypothetical protein
VRLSEGKKEDAIKRLKQRFEYDGPFIERALNLDPTGYKYADYLSKYLESVILAIAGDKGGLDMSSARKIENIIENSIPWFHRNVNKIKDEDILTASERYNEKYGKTPSIEGISKSIKDINQYAPLFILELKEVVDNRKTEREREKELKSQAKKIYEDENVLVVQPVTYEASCYYGANTKWCTTSSGSSDYLKKYLKNGELYYFINKKQNEKFALYRDLENRKSEVFNAQDFQVNLDVLRSKFPNQQDLIDELLGIGSFLKDLIGFAKGKVSAYTLKGSDDAIHRIKENDPLGASEIIIDLNKESELFEMLDLSEDDIWFYNVVNSSYSDYEYFDSYQIKEDFLQGYILYNDLNDKNIETIKKIAELIIPNEEFNIDDEDYRVKLSKTLYELFDNEIDYILGDYEVEKNREVSITVRESIDSELVNFFENLGFNFYSKHDMLSTTVGNLVMWARRLDVGKTDLISLLKAIFSYVNTGRLGGWYESQYEYQNIQNFDSES